jgi:hypothetical protein
VSRDDLGNVEDHDLVIAEKDLDGAANEAVRHAVANGLHVDERVRRNAPDVRCCSTGSGLAGSGRSACLSSRSKRHRGCSCVVPWVRVSATTIHAARCASSAAKLSKARPAIALRFT